MCPPAEHIQVCALCRGGCGYDSAGSSLRCTAYVDAIDDWYSVAVEKLLQKFATFYAVKQ